MNFSKASVIEIVCSMSPFDLMCFDVTELLSADADDAVENTVNNEMVPLWEGLGEGAPCADIVVLSIASVQDT